MAAAMQLGSIILCGGLSTRMGRDKATLPFGPELMLQRVVRLVSERIDLEQIVVVAAANQPLPELPTAVRITVDRRPECGPLEGLAAGLRATQDGIEAVYATSCDAPLLKPAFISRMFDSLQTYDIAVPFDAQYFHPLAAIYRPRVVEAIERLIESGQLRTSAIFDQVPTRRVGIEELRDVDQNLQSLMNLNRVDDYHAALASAGLAISASLD